MDQDLSGRDTGYTPPARPGVHAGFADLETLGAPPGGKGFRLATAHVVARFPFQVGQDEGRFPCGVARHGD